MKRVYGLIVMTAVMLACSDNKGSPPLAAERNPLIDSADQVMFGVRFNLTESGVARAYLEADTAIFLNANTRVELINVHTTFYNSSGDKDAVLTSRYGTYRTQAAQMVARGDVYIVSEDGRTLRSPEVRFDERRNEIASDSVFTVTGPERQLEGIGFRSDPNLHNVRVLQATTGTSGTITIPNQ